MGKVILRAIAEILLFVLLLPFKLAVFLWYTAKIVYWRATGELETMREGWEPFVFGMKYAFLREIRWVKTGEGYSLDDAYEAYLEES